MPGTASDRIIAAYRKYLFGDATLQNLPVDADGPRFVINATSVQTGALWRFSRPYMGGPTRGFSDCFSLTIFIPQNHRFLTRSRRSVPRH